MGAMKRPVTTVVRVSGAALLLLSLAAAGRPSLFMQTTGGDWIFALDKSGNEAVRRAVKLGRRNVEHVEVLTGLALGERVIVSDYSTYEHIETIDLVP